MYRCCVYFFVLVAFAGGCTTAAKKEVRTFVAAEQSRLLQAKARVEDPEAEEFLRSLALPILRAACELDGTDSPKFKHDKLLDIYDGFTVYLVHDATPNAWVVGDDFAVITTAALLQSEHPEEVAFVIAHEFGHIRGFHAVRSVERRYQTEFAAAMAVGMAAMAAGMQRSNPYYSQQQYQRDMDNAYRLGAAVLRSYTPHRKEDEHDADAQAVALMAQAGFSLDHCTGFLENMLEVYGDSGGKTHPLTTDRIKLVKAAVASYPEHQATRPLDVARFQRVRARVKEITLSQIEGGQLSFYADERLQLSGGASLPPVQACGPLEADIERVIGHYVDCLDR